MITFQNDHLVSYELCKLIYDTVPERYHVPVVFVPHTDRYFIRGTTCFGILESIEINLQALFYECYPGEVKLWKNLLALIYHEFGHIATEKRSKRGVPIRSNESFREEYYCEKLAHDFSRARIQHLAEHDKRLAQPKKLGPYFDGRIAKVKAKARKKFNPNGPPVEWFLKEYRCFVSGGQLSISDVARKVNAYKYPVSRWSDYGDRCPAPDTRLIRKLAEDLAYFYVDRAGRRLMFFAYGDVPEISRRVARYKAIHGPTRTQLEYIDQQGREYDPQRRKNAPQGRYRGGLKMDVTQVFI